MIHIRKKVMNDTTVSWIQDKNLFGSITVTKTNVGRKNGRIRRKPYLDLQQVFCFDKYKIMCNNGRLFYWQYPPIIVLYIGTTLNSDLKLCVCIIIPSLVKGHLPFTLPWSQIFKKKKKSCLHTVTTWIIRDLCSIASSVLSQQVRITRIVHPAGLTP